MQEKQTKKQILYEIFRFLIVGAVATLADYFVFYLMRNFILAPYLVPTKAFNAFSLITATAAGFASGLLVNWWLSVRFVFAAAKEKTGDALKQAFFKFFAVALVGLVLTEAGMHIFVFALPEITIGGVREILDLPLKEWIAKIVMTAIVLVWNYLGRKFWVFKAERNE